MFKQKIKKKNKERKNNAIKQRIRSIIKCASKHGN